MNESLEVELGSWLGCYTAVLLPSRGIMISPSGIENMVPSNQKTRTKGCCFDCFLRCTSTFSSYWIFSRSGRVGLFGTFQFVAIWDWSTSSQKLVAGIWEDMLVKGFRHPPTDRYLFLWGVPHIVWEYTMYISSTKGKGEGFMLHKALGSLRSHLSINFGGVEGGVVTCWAIRMSWFLLFHSLDSRI